MTLTQVGGDSLGKAGGNGLDGSAYNLSALEAEKIENSKLTKAAVKGHCQSSLFIRCLPGRHKAPGWTPSSVEARNAVQACDPSAQEVEARGRKFKDTLT